MQGSEVIGDLCLTMGSLRWGWMYLSSSSPSSSSSGTLESNRTTGYESHQPLFLHLLPSSYPPSFPPPHLSSTYSSPASGKNNFTCHSIAHCLLHQPTAQLTCIPHTAHLTHSTLHTQHTSHSTPHTHPRPPAPHITELPLITELPHTSHSCLTSPPSTHHTAASPLLPPHITQLPHLSSLHTVREVFHLCLHIP